MPVIDVLSSPPQCFARCPKKTRESLPVQENADRILLAHASGPKQSDRRWREMSERQLFSSRLSLTKLVAPPAALSLPARVAGPPRLALFVSHVAVPRRRARELRAAPRAVALCRRAGLFALVPQQVAKRRELPPVAPVFPALRFRPRV